MAGKLGRQPPDPRRRKLVLDEYAIAGGGLPNVPQNTDVDYASKISLWPMYDNDTCGSCTCAAFGHMIQSWTAYAGGQVVIPPANILDMYKNISGYNPATGANDNGAVMQDVLEYMRQTGVADNTGKVHKIVAYARMRDCKNQLALGQVLSVFGSVYVGVNFPASGFSQFDQGKPWNYVPGSANEGGHAICLQRRRTLNNIGILHYISWAREQCTTRSFQANYAEEGWAVVSEDFIRANGTTPGGYNLEQLTEDMHFVS